MKKLCFVLSCIFLVALSQAQNLKKAGNCTSYNIEGDEVVFHTSNHASLALKLCSEAVVRVWYAPDGILKRKNESFAVVNEQLGATTTIKVDEQLQAYEIFTGKLRIRINKEPLQLQIFDKFQKLLLGDYKDLGHVSDSSWKKVYKTLRPDEQFFGLGEKTGSLNRRGRSFKMWNSDQPCYGVNTDPLYKSIPFFLSNYKYGIFFDNTYKTEFKFGTESNQYYSFETPGGPMIYYFIDGNNYKEIIEQYTALTGKPIMPPEWAFGFSQSRGLYTNEVLARATAMEFRRRKIPCDIIFQDIGWVEELQNFEWDKKKYNNPKGMLKFLDSLGFKMIVSQDPVISQATTQQWHEADSLHYFTLDTRTLKSYDMPWPWGGNCGVVDFTKPGVASWWGNYQQKPLNDGVKGFWTDMGEPAWSNEDATDRLFMKHHLGMHDEIHNVYGLTWDKVVKEQFEKHNPNKRIFQMTRSAYAGLQRYTFGWSGDSGNGNDVLEGWKQLANQVTISLSAGLSVLPFWATDISGYCGDIKDYPAMAELYTRWMQFGIFNPISRAHHEGDNAVEPWKFGPETEQNCRKAIELKYRLFPYIYTYAREAHDRGLPLLRALLLEYPDDQEALKIDDEFLLGRELLVAPVVKKGAVSRQVYLPAGEWVDFNDGNTIYEGEQTILYKAPLNIIPIFIRRGSILPTMPVMQYIHEKKTYPLSIDIFPGTTGQEAAFDLYEDDGITLGYQHDMFRKTAFKCITKSHDFEIRIDAPVENGFKINGSRNFLIRLHMKQKPLSVTLNDVKVNTMSPAFLSSGLEKEFRTRGWYWDKTSGICTIRLADTGKPQLIVVSH